MKAAVVYYSLEGNSKWIAEQIATRLDADVIPLLPEQAYPTGKVSKFFWGGKSAVMSEAPKLKPYAFQPERYDTVIVGCPLWAWRIAPPLRSFLSEQNLQHMQVAAFVSCGGGNPEKAYADIRALSGHDTLLAECTLTEPLKKPQDAAAGIETFCRKILGQ